MTFTTDDLAPLKAALLSGATSISANGRTVTFQSLGALRKLISEIESSIAAAVPGASLINPNKAVATFSKYGNPGYTSSSSVYSFNNTNDIIEELSDDLPFELITEAHDDIQYIYTSGNLTQTVYRMGGVAGIIVATLNYEYDGSGNLIRQWKS